MHFFIRIHCYCPKYKVAKLNCYHKSTPAKQASHRNSEHGGDKGEDLRQAKGGEDEETAAAKAKQRIIAMGREIKP